MSNGISRTGVREPSRRAAAAWLLAWAIATAWLLVAPLARAAALPAEDGYDLWLRYIPIQDQWQSRYRAAATELIGADTSATLEAAQAELLRGLDGLLGAKPLQAHDVTRDGAIVFGTPGSSSLIRSLSLDLHGVGAEGYFIRTVTTRGHTITVIAANSDIGVLYGAFGFLRPLQTR